MKGTCEGSIYGPEFKHQHSGVHDKSISEDGEVTFCTNFKEESVKETMWIVVVSFKGLGGVRSIATYIGTDKEVLIKQALAKFNRTGTKVYPEKILVGTLTQEAQPVTVPTYSLVPIV